MNKISTRGFTVAMKTTTRTRNSNESFCYYSKTNLVFIMERFLMEKCFDECLAPNKADEEKKMLPINVKMSNTQETSTGIPYKDIATRKMAF